MTDLAPQTAAGRVLLHFAMSLDGFVAGPGHSMDFMSRATNRPGLVQEYVETTGAILAGRAGFDSAIADSRPYGGAWQGPIFVLTHHPEDATPDRRHHVPVLPGPGGGGDRARGRGR